MRILAKVLKSCMYCSLCVLLASATAVAWGEQLAFELPTADGRRVAIAPGQKRLTAICFLGTQCPMARAYVATLNRLQSEFDDELRLVAVMSNRQDSEQDVHDFIESLGVKFEVLVDAGNRVADQYGASRTPEVFLLDEELRLRYHGRIDDQYAPSVARAQARREDLRAAVNELLQGKPVSVKETRAMGCIIGKVKVTEAPPGVASEVTFAADVYPMLKEHCIECHRAGEIGPFAMDSYEEVVGWADTMMESIDDGRMPPWHADPAYGRFANQRLMPVEDRELLRSWIAAGAPAGDADNVTLAESRPARLASQDKYLEGWQFKQPPELVLAMRDRPFTVPRDGIVEYQYFVVDPGFERDRWIRAAQVIPGSRDVVHHAIVFVRPPDGSEFDGVGWLTAYVPGQRALEMPPGHARKIPAGSKLVFQMHYTPNGTQRDDLSRVGLIFADQEQVTDQVITLMALEQEFEIPPSESSHRVSARLRRMPDGAKLLAATPHMHYRGKAFTLFADRRNKEVDSQSSDILLDVPRYDFNWQHTYQFAEPHSMDDIQQLRFEAVFDNSKQNPFNPDPDEWVTWGDQTWEEMAVAFFEVSLPRTPDPHPSRAARRKSGGESGLAPVSHSDRVQSQVEAYVRRVFERMDENGDGVIHKSENSIVVRHFHFAVWDEDNDGRITQSEVRSIAEQLYQ